MADYELGFSGERIDELLSKVENLVEPLVVSIEYADFDETTLNAEISETEYQRMIDAFVAGGVVRLEIADLNTIGTVVVSVVACLGATQLADDSPLYVVLPDNSDNKVKQLVIVHND